MTIDQAVDIAIDNTIVDGLTDIFGDFLEVSLLSDPESRSLIKKDIVTCIEKKQFNQLDPLPIQYILIPKSHHAYDYRRGALMHLYCHLKYLTLCLLVVEKVESHRISVDRKIVFSNRYLPKDGKLFPNKDEYTHWLEDYIEKKKSKKYRVIVQCDIASFFDRLNLHRLESTLEDIGVEDWIRKTINDLLEHWAKKDSYGLPIGSNASRILAEAALIDIDNFLCDEGIEYTRYVDDFRLFAPDVATAQKWITRLITKLFREGLLLNASKTRFIDCLKEEKPKIDETEVAEAEQVANLVTRLVGRYNRIPRVFRMPAKEKYEIFNKVDIDLELKEIKDDPMSEFDKIQKVIIASLIKGRWETIALCPVFIRDCPYGINYILDMLEKNKAIIPTVYKRKLSDELGTFIIERQFENIDWYEAAILKLLSTEDYYNKKVLMKYILSSTKLNTTLPSMIAIEGIAFGATRTDVKTIRELYEKCDQWEQRRIIYLVYKKLPEEERKAWLRAIQPLIQDTVTKIIYKKAMYGNL